MWMTVHVILLGHAAISAAPTLGGNYAYVLETKTTTPLPIVKDYTATTRSVAWVQLEQGERTLKGRGRVCSITIVGSSSLIQTEIPAAFVRSLPEVELNARWTESNGQIRIEQGPKTLVVGAKLADEKHDELPKRADDPRVIDQDGDGQPAMTVRVRGLVSGEVYVVQRSTSQWSGVRQGQDFRGPLHFSAEQSVIGASSAFLKGNRSNVPNPSRFQLLRLGNGAGCEAAEKRVRALR